MRHIQRRSVGLSDFTGDLFSVHWLVSHTAISRGWSLGTEAMANSSYLLRLVEYGASKVICLFRATTDCPHLHFSVLHVPDHTLLLLTYCDI